MADHQHPHPHHMPHDSEDSATLAAEFLPTPQDPRIALTLKADRRDAVQSLWALAIRLTKLLDDVREPLIGQIKLAWWRDMMAMLATDAASLPMGEPLLADIQAHFSGVAGLQAIVDAAEAMLMADDVAARTAAAKDFGRQLFVRTAACQHDPAVSGAVSGRTSAAGLGDGAGHAWGLLWGAYVHRGTPDGAAMLSAAAEAGSVSARQYGRGQRGLVMLDRLAAQIGGAQGARDLRREGLMLLRIGLFGR